MKKSLLTLFVTAVLTVSSFGQNSIDNPFFDHVTFRGAFGTIDWTAGWANFDPQNTVYPATTVVVNAGDISVNTTWTNDQVYLLNGWVYVTSGTTLTIQPGTIIRGDKANKGTLIIEPGAKIMAQGTLAQPIVFTSNQAPGDRTYGDWGGLIVAGKARVNKVSPQIEGGPRTTYGGDNDADNSGVLTYIRVEFPGIAFQPDKEINGITFGGVGSGTFVSHLQVSYCGDDSFEWFGGTVNAKYLIALRGWDDDFDTDYGYRGMVQYAVSLRDPDIADPGSGSNGFEADNDGSGSGEEPISQPIFSNVSIFGPLVTPATEINSNYLRAMHLRRNTRINIFNAIFTGYPVGLYIEGPSVTNAQGGLLRVENTILAGMTTNFGVKASDLWTLEEETAWFNDASHKNQLMGAVGDLQITNPFNLTAPNFMPLAGSPVMSGSYWASTGIPTIRTYESLMVYPNPASHDIYFGGDVRVKEVRIINLTGQVVKETLLDSNQVSVGELNPGLYFIQAVLENGKTATQKFYKQ